MANAALKGVPYSDYVLIIEQIGLPLKQLSHLLGISELKLHRTIEARKPLENIASERLLNLGKVFAHGADTFGKVENFKIWIARDIPALGGQKPIDLMHTEAGIRFVDNELGKIEHGLLA
jgi:putative toxin-antitoxin system antitoxin component (TIGR02293 family)